MAMCSVFELGNFDFLFNFSLIFNSRNVRKLCVVMSFDTGHEHWNFTFLMKAAKGTVPFRHLG